MTPVELAVLTVLAEKPRHGYDIEKIIEDRGFREWADIGFSSIYYVLNKLEKDGLVLGQLAPAQGKGAARKIYHLTSQGKHQHKEAVLQALSTPQRRTSLFLLGFANIPALNEDELRTALREYAEALEQESERLKHKAVSQDPIPDFVQAMFDYSQALIAAEMHWVQDWLTRMEQEHAED